MGLGTAGTACRDPLASQLAADAIGRSRAPAQSPGRADGLVVHGLAEMVRHGLTDADAFVRRAAADATGPASSRGQIRPLLALWSATPADDTHLIHATRMALRDQLRPADAFATLDAALKSDPADAGANWPTSAAACRRRRRLNFCFTAWKTTPSCRNGPATLHQVVRYIPADRLADVVCVCPGDRAAEIHRSGGSSSAKSAKGLRSAAPSCRRRSKPGAVTFARQLLASGQETEVQAGLELVREVPGLPLYEQCARPGRSREQIRRLRARRRWKPAWRWTPRDRSLCWPACCMTRTSRSTCVSRPATLLAKLNKDAARRSASELAGGSGRPGRDVGRGPGRKPARGRKRC